MMLYIKNDAGYKGVYSRISCAANTKLYSLESGKLTKMPTRTSIQVGEGLHVEDEVGGCINHSCSPSCLIQDLFVIALRDIKVGEEITFDYNKNEKRLASPFKCNCCGKMIRGKDYE